MQNLECIEDVKEHFIPTALSFRRVAKLLSLKMKGDYIFYDYRNDSNKVSFFFFFFTKDIF